MWVEFNNNPHGKRVGDCSVRAVSVAHNIPWQRAYALMAVKGYANGDMPSSDAIWGAVLKDRGFNRYAVSNTCPDCYTASDFCKDNKKGIYVLGFGGHVATAVNGTLFDSWDSSSECPQFFWYRKE